VIGAAEIFSLALIFLEFSTNTIKMKHQIARIPVQNSFCELCKTTIQTKLSKIRDVSNVRLYPQESLVVFNFFKANELSNVLNALTEMGYPEKGEQIDHEIFLKSKLCLC
jgi:hypothetical protein